MGMKQHCLGAAAAVALCAFAIPAMAAPIGPSGLKSASTSANIQKVDFRRCWWHHGRRVCRWYRRSYEYYPSYGYYPFFGFSFGGHRHHFHGFHGHHGGHHHH